MEDEKDEEYQWLDRMCKECNLSARQISRECNVEAFKYKVSLELDAFDPHEPSRLGSLMYFGGVMLEAMILNVEEWKHRAIQMGMEATQVDALVVSHSNEEDAPPLPTIEDMSKEAYYTSTRPNIDSWLESNLREKHEALFDEIENLVEKLGDLCKGDEEIQFPVLHEFPLETLKKVPQVEEIAKLSLWPELFELIFQSIMMAVLRNWKKKKMCAQRFLLCNMRSSMVRCPQSLKLISMLEKRELEQRWWKKKKWRDKLLLSQHTLRR